MSLKLISILFLNIVLFDLKVSWFYVISVLLLSWMYLDSDFCVLLLTNFLSRQWKWWLIINFSSVHIIKISQQVCASEQVWLQSKISQLTQFVVTFSLRLFYQWCHTIDTFFALFSLCFESISYTVLIVWACLTHSDWYSLSQAVLIWCLLNISNCTLSVKLLII